MRDASLKFLSAEITMLESWLLSWGAEVQVLRPAAMARRLADEQERAARQHRAASAAFTRLLDDDEGGEGGDSSVGSPG